MSESNLTPGEGHQDLGGSKYGAQRFQPKETHVLRYIDLELDSQVKGLATWAKVYVADANGHPWGSPISTTLHPWTAPNGDRTPYRARIAMMPTFLIAEHPFVMVIYSPKAPRPWSNRWLYQQDLSLYPRGWRLHSGDYGETWSEDWADDHVFAEFGNPPVFEVPYNPPPLYWALVYVSENYYNTSACYRFGTSSPVTMTLHITENEPKAMETFKIVRGVKTKCLSFYSFNSWRTYLQMEKGDSIYHTFHVTKLKEGQHYWLVNTAESDLNPSLSISPVIVRVHPGGPPFTTIRRPDAPGFACNPRIDGNGLPCPDHYLTVNEATPDEETSQLYSAFMPSSWARDLYLIPDYAFDPRPINEIHITGRFKNIGTRPASAVAWLIIRTHGLIYQDSGTWDMPPYYKNRHWHLHTNPFTDLPWTSEEVSDLEIGVQLRNRRGIGWTARGYCTQLYLTIEHKCEAFE